MGLKSGGKTTQTKSVKLPSWQEAAIRQGTQAAVDLYNQGAPEYYSGQTYADFTPEQLAAQEGTISRATNGSPLITSASDLTSRTLAGDYLSGSPQLEEMLARLGAKANATVAGNFNLSGRLGSGANVATGTQAFTDATAPLLFQNYQNERGLQNAAINNAQSLAANDYRDLAALQGVGDVRQSQAQRAIDEDRARYEYDAMAQSNWLDQYLNRINSSAANNLTTTTNTQKQSGGGLGEALGAALSIGSMFVPGGQFAGLLGGLGSFGGMSAAIPGITSVGLPSQLGAFSAASDRRLKDNIEEFGTENGHKVYKFTYKDDKSGKIHIGVMSDDVRKIMPEAVTVGPNGFDQVNYSMIGVKFREAN